MDDLCPVVLVYLGRCYLPDPLGPFFQRWSLLGLPLECYALRSFNVVALPDHCFV